MSRVEGVVFKFFLFVAIIVPYVHPNLYHCSFFKLPADFQDDKEYNDYLEEVEDMVFNLVNDVDVQATYARLEAFRADNRDALESAHARLAHEQRQEEAAARAAQVEREKRRQEEEKREAEEQAERHAAKRSLIEELVSLELGLESHLSNAKQNSFEPRLLLMLQLQLSWQKLKRSSKPAVAVVVVAKRTLPSRPFNPGALETNQISHRSSFLLISPFSPGCLCPSYQEYQIH